MNSPKDTIAAQLENTLGVQANKEAVIDAIDDTVSNRLAQMFNPLCIGPQDGDLLFVEGARPREDMWKHGDHDYESTTQRASASGLRLLKPLEARRVERVTGRDFTNWVAFPVGSYLDSTGQKYIFATHPTWDYEGGHFFGENRRGSHIQFRGDVGSPVTRRGFSIPWESPLESNSNTEKIEEIIRRYEVDFLAHPIFDSGFHPTEPTCQTFVGWPDKKTIRDTLNRATKAIEGMAEQPYILFAQEGSIRVVDPFVRLMMRVGAYNKLVPASCLRTRLNGMGFSRSHKGTVYVRPEDEFHCPGSSLDLDLVFKGEWRLAS